MSLLSLAEAQERVLALAPVMPAIRCETRAASGAVLAEDLVAARTQPSADLSAMDGYAVSGEGPWQRIGESRAGTPFQGVLSAGECTRISTGAQMPDGAEAVLMQENARVQDTQVALARGEAAPPAGRHIRRAGFDFAAGDIVLPRGTALGPAQIALALAAGHGSVPVFEKPCVDVLDSGDELAEDPGQCAPGEVPASNGAMIAAMLAPHAASLRVMGPVADDMGALAAALEQSDAPLLVTSGGASVGDHDLVQRALEASGAEIAFWKAAIKPGKPLMVVQRTCKSGRRQVVLGLPGNPVSSFVTAFLFALPLLRAAGGHPALLPRMRPAIAAEPIPGTGMRHEFLRAIERDDGVALAGSQDSSALLSLARATCLVDRPPGAGPVEAGETIWVYNLQIG